MKHVVKIIGVLLFAWILWKIDIGQLLLVLKSMQLVLIIPVILCMIGIILAKTCRWHVIVTAANINPTFLESLHIYLIGIFLGTITPAKIGEIGKAAYLRKNGMALRTGIWLSIVDRIADVILVISLGILGIGILFNTIIQSLALLIVLILMCIVIYIINRKRFIKILNIKTLKMPPRIIFSIAAWTIIGWIFYFAWAVFLARSIGIILPTYILISSFAVASCLSLLPIAPSGLGTRDAALLFFLIPYRLTPETIISVSILMFVFILLMSVPGGILWIQKKT